MLSSFVDDYFAALSEPPPPPAPTGPTTLVYRVEDQHGEGPYGSDTPFCAVMGVRHTGDNDHPGPSSERWHTGDRFHYDPDYRFGFVSLRQLLSWFTPDDRRELEHLGFRIVRYVAPSTDVRVGTRQIVFRSSTAHRLKEHTS